MSTLFDLDSPTAPPARPFTVEVSGPRTNFLGDPTVRFTGWNAGTSNGDRYLSCVLYGEGHEQAGMIAGAIFRWICIDVKDRNGRGNRG